MRNLQLRRTTVARTLPNATLVARGQDEICDVVARPRVQAERSAEREVRYQDVQRTVRGMQRRVERARLADE